jgi:hypothetical protein
MKVNVLKYILESAYTLALLTKIPPDGYRNVNLSMQISNILFTCHGILRQKASGLSGNMDKKSQSRDFIVNYMGSKYSAGKEETLNILNTCAKKYGLQHKKYDTNDKENWYGVAGPYLFFFFCSIRPSIQ